MTGGPPPFKQARTVAAYRTPEELFYALAGRAKSHAYLRGPQQDVLREYVAHSDDADVAFELPTGTGKTTVGLVIADWKRRQGMRCAFLALTNQLAGQVLAEGERLGIECADLRGRKGERNPAEEGRFLTGTATGVSVYSNLFNVKPVIKGCDFLVFDDAHGGEQYVSGMWTVSIGVEETPELYNEVLVALKPVLSESQIRSLLDRSASSVELADVWSDVGVLPKLAGVLEEGTENTNLAYPWWMIRNRLQSCLVLLSSYEITLRPYVAPTHTHEPFVAAKQRVYMSATLGGESDLQRAYGIQKLAIVRAQGAQWGKRYVFIPQLYTDRGTSVQILASVWDRMKTRRAVILAPSDRAMNGAFQILSREMSPVPMRMLAADITDTLDA